MDSIQVKNRLSAIHINAFNILHNQTKISSMINWMRSDKINMTNDMIERFVRICFKNAFLRAKMEIPTCIESDYACFKSIMAYMTRFIDNLGNGDVNLRYTKNNQMTYGPGAVIRCYNVSYTKTRGRRYYSLYVATDNSPIVNVDWIDVTREEGNWWNIVAIMEDELIKHEKVLQYVFDYIFDASKIIINNTKEENEKIIDDHFTSFERLKTVYNANKTIDRRPSHLIRASMIIDQNS